MYLDDPWLIDDSAAIVEDMDALISDRDLSDVTFVVEGERIHAHRVILAARCEYFRQGNASLLRNGIFSKCRVRCAELCSMTD